VTETIAPGHGPGDEIESAFSHIEPGRFIENDPGIDDGGDHQPVPVGQDLVVEPGVNARIAYGEEFFPQPGQAVFVFRAARMVCKPVENIVTFKISVGSHVVMAREELTVLGAQCFYDVRMGPDVKLAFFAF
jgi:hypothetical protein